MTNTEPLLDEGPGEGLRAGLVPPALLRAYRSGAPIVVVGRFSGEWGTKSYETAVNDALEAANYLAHLGVDIRRELPSKRELVETLRRTTPVKSRSSTGAAFTNRYLVLDYRHSHGVVVVISNGTGKKLDDNGNQPFVNYVAGLIESIGAVALIANRVDRMTRRAWALGQIMLQLSNRSGYIGDRRYGIRPAEGIDSILTFFSAQASEDEAAKLPAQTRRGMRDATGTSLALGECPWGVAGVAPPGFVTYRTLQSGRIGGRVLTFDSPTCRPAESRIAAGWPDVYDAKGVPADQVENVRWFLRHAGQPGWSARKLAEHLVARGYSTEALRRLSTPSACFDPHVASTRPYRVIRSMLNNLDVYEFGVIEVPLGVEGFDPVRIADAFPPDGEPWAAKEDFDRIRAWEAGRAHRPHRGITFAGVPVLVDGESCVFVTKSPKREADRSEGALGTDLATDSGRSSGRASTSLVRIRPNLLTDALANAIIKAGDSALSLVQLDDYSTVDRFELTAAEVAVRSLEDQRLALERQLSATDVDGSPILHGAFLHKATDTYNQLNDVDIPQAKQRLALAENDYEARKVEHVRSEAGLASGALLRLLESLRDPFSELGRVLVHRSVRNMVITTTRHEVQHRRWFDYEINFEFVIANGSGAITIPVSTSARHGNVFSIEAIATDTLDQLLTGPTTVSAISPFERLKVMQDLAARFGIRSRRFMLGNVTDPRLAHLVALVLVHGPEEAAKCSSESQELLERILHVHTSATRNVWRLHPSPVRKLLYDLANQGLPVDPNTTMGISTSWDNARAFIYSDPCRDQWKWTGDCFVLMPCPSCGSSRRRQLMIPEPAGLVCLDCRRDQMGFLWPASEYDCFQQ